MTPPLATHQLAQLNIGLLHEPIDHPTIAEFNAALDPINALAESAPGFVWRLTADDGQSSSYVQVSDDPLFVVNLSVWTDPEALWAFVYQTEHVNFLRRRREWFQAMDTMFAVCWWVPAGHTPSVDEALGRLERLRRDGSTADAFAFRRPFPAPPAG